MWAQHNEAKIEEKILFIKQNEDEQMPAYVHELFDWKLLIWWIFYFFKVKPESSIDLL